MAGLSLVLEGKVALITGGSRGIGAETVRMFASHGYQVRVIGELPDDPGQFDQLFVSIKSACLTVMELKVPTDGNRAAPPAPH